jgi:two-component system phosphate regulon sensor histidine kinase PhoR
MPDDLLRCAPLIEAMPDPALLVAADRRIVTANSAARELFSVPLNGALVLSHIRQPEVVAALERGFAALASRPRQAEAVEARMILASGLRETVLQVRIAPLPEGVGMPALLITLRDISQIEDAEQQRRDFVANVSHEMRSPLTVLSGFIETLKGAARDDPRARAQFLDIMDREANRMSRLVSDLLSLSRVEADERVRPRDPVSLTDVLKSTLAALRPQIEAAGLEVAFADQSAGATVPGDRDQLVQVFHNLVENAVKYGATGGRIDIAIARAEAVPGMAAPALRVTVRDHGDGIDAIHVPRLTERFYRVDGHRSRAMGGTGLGLAIVKHIINRHRGRLTVTSTRGEGSCFAVVLPIR